MLGRRMGRPALPWDGVKCPKHQKLLLDGKGICEAFLIAVSRPGQKNMPHALFLVGRSGTVPNLVSVSNASVPRGARFQSGLLVLGAVLSWMEAQKPVPPRECGRH